MWYKAYQWEDNPFSIKPNTNLIGLEKEKEQVIEQGLEVPLLGTRDVGSHDAHILRVLE